jgi:hypothetical protein
MGFQIGQGPDTSSIGESHSGKWDKSGFHFIRAVLHHPSGVRALRSFTLDWVPNQR